jgi:hypothetical protein
MVVGLLAIVVDCLNAVDDDGFVVCTLVIVCHDCGDVGLCDAAVEYAHERGCPCPLMCPSTFCIPEVAFDIPWIVVLVNSVGV